MKRYLNLIFVPALTLAGLAANAQTLSNDSVKVKNPRNILYAELGGSSVIYTFNYERILVQKEKYQFSLRVGFGCFPMGSFNGETVGYKQYSLSNMVVLPVEGLFSFGKGRHKVEVNAGIAPIVIRGSEQSIITYPNGDVNIQGRTYTDCVIAVGPGVAYRYEKKEGGLFLRAGVSANYFFNTNPAASTTAFSYPLPMPKFSIGYKFHR